MTSQGQTVFFYWRVTQIPMEKTPVSQTVFSLNIYVDREKSAFEESGPVVGLGLGGAAPQRAAAKNGDF